MLETIYIYEGTVITDVVESDPKTAWQIARFIVNQNHYHGASDQTEKGFFSQTPGRVAYQRGSYRAVNAYRND